MLACYPHGMLNIGYLLNQAGYYPSMIIMSSRMMLAIPINGLFLRWCNVDAVDPTNLRKLMK